MTILPIRLYPDPILRQEAAPVTFLYNEMRLLYNDLVETMLAAPGVGITACHVGILKRIYVLKLENDADAACYINPEIIGFSDKIIVATEGSVSMPGVREEIERADGVTIRYQDLDGVWQEEIASGFRAVCHQHEIDQLDGVFWLERLSRLKRERLIKKWKKA